MSLGQEDASLASTTLKVRLHSQVTSQSGKTAWGALMQATPSQSQSGEAPFESLPLRDSA